MEESLQILRSLKNNLSSSYLSESDQNEIIDFWIEKYAKNRKLEHNSAALKGKEEDCATYLSQIPEIKKFFGTGELLKNRIKERISELLPF